MSYTKEQIQDGFDRWRSDVASHPDIYLDNHEDSNNSDSDILIEFIENHNHSNKNT